MRKIYNKFLYAWYAYPSLFILLLPVTLIYRVIIFIRRLCYERGLCKVYRAPCPVIIVGNFIVGGTGKSPTVIALAQLLKDKGFKPGIITRGYGSNDALQNILVTPQSDPARVGDESVMIAQKTGVPVVKNKQRAKAAQALIDQCDVIVSDDGLQHYALAADIKIALLPDPNGLRNFFCLPAGPWREPKARLSSVDFAIQTQTKIEAIVPLARALKPLELADFRGKKVHAVCGIAAPWRFFSMLNSLGINTINHAYPDHYAIKLHELTFPPDDIVLITEKDAVKCQDFYLSNVWVVKIKAQLESQFIDRFMEKLTTKVQS